MTTVAIQIPTYAGATDLTLFLHSETDATFAVANGSGDAMTPGSNGGFTATVAESLSGVYNVVIKQGSTVVASGGKVRFDGSATVFVDSTKVGDEFVPRAI